MTCTEKEAKPIQCSNLAPAARLLKALGHEGRLRIICYLAAGERSVSELEELLGMRQAAVSQQLARLRLDGVVTSRRHGKAIIYRLSGGSMHQKVSGVLNSIEAGAGAPNRRPSGRADAQGS